MTAVPTPRELADLDDEQIASLAANWRVRAGYGDRNAFGIAHALEVEQRRRLRDSQLHQLPQLLAGRCHVGRRWLQHRQVALRFRRRQTDFW